MNITPDQARALLDEATPGPWDIRETDALMGGRAFNLRQSGKPGIRVSATTYGHNDDPELIAAAPELAQTIAGMTEEWGVERDRPGTAYIDGTVARWITWIGDEARARKACVISPRGGNPRLVRRLVGPVEVAE